MSILTIPVTPEWKVISDSFTPTGDKYVLDNSSSVTVQVGFGTAVEKIIITLYPQSERTLSVKNMGPLDTIFLRTLLNQTTAVVAYDDD